MADDRWLIAGLGNPGPEYAGNRHNAGFMVVDVLAERIGARFRAHKSSRGGGRAEAAVGRLGDRQVVLVKPLSYMNLSGGPVGAVRDFYKVPVERVIVVHDELDLDFGVLRLKRGGGSGGHNGLKSLTGSLGGPDYLRVRFGIGRPPGRMDPAAYVLRDFTPAERTDLGVELERAADAVEALMRLGLAAAQNEIHAR